VERSLIAILSVGLATAFHSPAQQVDPLPLSFEVASVKPGDPGGPKWLDSGAFNIDAKVGDSVTIPAGEAGGALFRSMLRSLLVERFSLAFHREPRLETVYRLVIAKGGPKLKATEAPKDGPRGLRKGQGRITGMAASMPMLASRLAQQLERPVTDDTGLNGEYDFVVDYAPDSVSTTTDQPDAADDLSRPSIFTAVQEQLGLRLESTKGTVEVLVIDHAEKPSAN
jgi:uncharacterized protein (TIGR03435 family)